MKDNAGMVNRTFKPGDHIRVTQGTFYSMAGAILDHDTAVDGRGSPYPTPRPGYFWVMLTVFGAPVPAHLFHDEMEPA